MNLMRFIRRVILKFKLYLKGRTGLEFGSNFSFFFLVRLEDMIIANAILIKKLLTNLPFKCFTNISELKFLTILKNFMIKELVTNFE